ncbi:MAG: MMPL family transporter, partial [Halobacteriales archaeon]|nr:MMPL family transporter [Halobacteriales archaeon]
TLQSLTGGGSNVNFPVLVTGTGVIHPETLRWMDDFEQTAVASPTIVGVDTPADLVRSYNRGVLPETEAGVEAVLDRVPPPVRAQYVRDGTALITVESKADMDTDQEQAFRQSVGSAVVFSEPPPGIDAALVDSGVITGGSITSAVEGRNRTTALGLLLVSLLLIGYYRDLVKAVVPIVPILFVIGWQGIFMYLLGIPISPLGAALGALTVGIGAEYTIIPMERYYEERSRGHDRLDAVEIAMGTVGKTITISGMTTVFGFSALILSPFPILSDFGMLTVGVIALTLIAALTTLPPTLVLLDEVAETVTARGASIPGTGADPDAGLRTV